MTNVFRSHTPKRREITRVVTTHRDHKADLRIDFKQRCGYCNSLDKFKTTYFEIDHFIPEAILTIKSLTDYTNLVYSCRSCNNAKRKKWGTHDENIPIKDDKGFVEPCDDEYNSHFRRNEKGQILYTSNLGKWMHNALKLHKPQHEILWKLEQLDDVIKELKEMINKGSSNSNLKDLLLDTYEEYHTYINQFTEL